MRNVLTRTETRMAASIDALENQGAYSAMRNRLITAPPKMLCIELYLQHMGLNMRLISGEGVNTARWQCMVCGGDRSSRLSEGLKIACVKNKDGYSLHLSRSLQETAAVTPAMQS